MTPSVPMRQGSDSAYSTS